MREIEEKRKQLQQTRHGAELKEKVSKSEFKHWVDKEMHELKEQKSVLEDLRKSEKAEKVQWAKEDAEAMKQEQIRSKAAIERLKMREDAGDDDDTAAGPATTGSQPPGQSSSAKPAAA